MPLPPPFIEQTNNINAIIETPKGSRNKYVYDPGTHLLKLKKSLPAGMVFPFDFGFIPFTLAEDRDPLDILVLTDAPTHPGCWVECLVLGVIKVQQKKSGKVIRNDRIVAVQLESRSFSYSAHLDDLPDGLVKEIINFFASYKHVSDQMFEYLGSEGPKGALQLIRKAMV